MPRTTYLLLARWLPVSAFLDLGLLAWQGPSSITACGMLAALCLITLQITWQDASEFTISDTAISALALVGLASRLSQCVLGAEPLLQSLSIAALEAVLCGGAFLLVRELYYRLRGCDGLGLGDVKLAAAGGFLLGTEGFAWSTLIASLAGLVFAFVLRIRIGGSGPTDPPIKVPLGALLAPAFYLVWLATIGSTQLSLGMSTTFPMDRSYAAH